MDPETVEKLEGKIEETIAGIVVKMRLKWLPLAIVRTPFDLPPLSRPMKYSRLCRAMCLRLCKKKAYHFMSGRSTILLPMKFVRGWC